MKHFLLYVESMSWHEFLLCIFLSISTIAFLGTILAYRGLSRYDRAPKTRIHAVKP